MGHMAGSPKRADVSSETGTPDAWDAGLHAESAAGPIDVGLSVEPSAVGLIIDAPGIGILKLAFDLHPDGSARLSRASRRLKRQRQYGQQNTCKPIPHTAFTATGRSLSL